ncbi:hypothetical protein V2A60_006828 [Cordyceps javanica]|uniref:DNA-binding protein RAP1 n=1 Tax=Cordyceps javanica TaxID=43265 RepID=A0A545W5Y1_9HYPO|nr:transcription factor Rap1 [Cordyceps javanica]TQW09397.1 transcription factor Rap1 [Cordyceps javanica]
MSGGITYSGVPVEIEGRIFDGLKFWVAQRVPLRSSLLDQIQRNSGVIVPLEKNADYLIADHARKDVPMNSISWKFITESVQNGFVQLPDHYWIKKVRGTQRQAAPERSDKRTTRAGFTLAEDAALARWVLAHDGQKAGNLIYQHFAAKHPRHSWQSWRTRYVKKLSLLPEGSLEQLAIQVPSSQMCPAIEEEEQPDRELPDPTELMLQRKSERVQQETALRRAKNRAIQPLAAAAAQPSASSPPPQVHEHNDIAITEAKNRFYEDLQCFSELNEVTITPTQQVAGQLVDLWELSTAVSGQRLPAEEIDWLRVAEELGYEWTDVDAAVRALQLCFQENLAEFLTTMELMFDEDEDPEPTPHASPAATTARNMPSSPMRQMPSSPPARFLPGKRSLDADSELDIPTPAKRRRIHLPAEIPSTPEANRHQPMPVSSRHPAGAATTPVRFETQVASLHARESSLDMTPSQQLQSEHLNSSPIPLRINSAARNHQVGDASNARIRKRRLPASFPPSAPPGQDRRGPDPSFAPGDTLDHRSPFPGALPRALSPPVPVARRPAQAAPRRLSKERELSDLIQHYESLGYSHKTVVEGLRRTTMTPGLATVVMQSLKEGQGVPTHHEGIWTDRDDTGLRLVAGVEGDLDKDVRDKEQMKTLRKARRARDRLLNKHGQERMALRIKYLRASDSLAAAAAAVPAPAAADAMEEQSRPEASLFVH